MKIKSIKINNLGPYVGECKLDFNISNPDKNIILIGGKNGAGKTSLFNAVKLCIYGSRASGYEKVNQIYLDQVTALINTAVLRRKSGSAFISTTLFIDDGKQNSSYEINRKWDLAGKKIKESVVVVKDEKQLSEIERIDFESYIFQLIPPNLFKFYFFDGEKISDFAFDGVQNSDFKQAFLQLCGLDTLEIILSNFKRTYKGSNSKSSCAQEYDDVCLRRANNNELIANKGYEKDDVLKSIIAVDEKLAIAESAYSNSGGVDVKVWGKMHDQLKKEENFRAEKRKWLKEVANNVLPFIILRSQLEELKVRIERENYARNKNIVKSEMQNELIKDRLNKLFNDLHVPSSYDVTAKVIFEILDAMGKEPNCDEEILMLSTREELELIPQINSLLAFDISRIKEATEDINKSLKNVDKIRDKIKKSTVTDYETFLVNKQTSLAEKEQLISKSVEVERELLELIGEDLKIEAEYKKVKSKYEEELKSKSINDISAKAILAFEELQCRLYKSFIQQVETEFKQTFDSLINKSDLLDGILVDEHLKVIPYKNTAFMRDELAALRKNFGDEYIINLIGQKAFAIMQDKLTGKETKFVLPAQVKQQLSAGEKQVFIMSLYKALVSLSKVNVPYIIDTPFARIDGEHRKNILENFFVKLNGQVIILSTDEEIVDNYKDIISGKISNTFVLEHQPDGSSKIINNKYFEESHDC